MYKPDLDDGWFKLAHALLPALLLPRFPNEAACVLCSALAQVYGAARRRIATLDMPEVARFWHLNRTNAWRGLRYLKERGVLYEIDPTDACRVKFSKQALLALLPPDKAAAVAVFSMLAKQYDRDDAADASVSRDDTVYPIRGVSSGDTASVTFDKTSVSPDDTQTVSRDDTVRVSPDDTVFVPPCTPYKEEEFKKEEEEVVVVTRAGTASVPGTGSGTDADRRNRIVALADSLRPMEGASSKIDGFLGGYDAGWVEMAVLTAMASEPPVKNLWQYINKCLIKWKASGGPAPAERRVLPIAGAARPGYTTAVTAKRAAWLASLAELEAAEASKEGTSHAG